MGTFVPTVDLLIPGGTLGIGTTNASTINIGNQNSSTNVKNTLNLTGTVNFSNITLFPSSVVTTDYTNTAVNINLSNVSKNMSVYDVAIGYNTMTNSGGYNVAIGGNALGLTNTSAQVGIGYQTLSANTNGTGNNAIGYQSLQSNVSGSNNTGFGFNTLNLNKGANNTAIGYNAERYTQNVNSSYNTVIGYQAFTATNNTSTNVIVNSTAIGANSTTNGNSSSTAIGYNASCSAANQIMLGTSSETVVIPGALTTTGTVTTAKVDAPSSTGLAIGTTNATSIGIGSSIGLTTIYGGSTSVTNKDSNNYIKFTADGNNTNMEFHCNSAYNVIDAQITCQKNTTNTANNSNLLYNSVSNYFYGTITSTGLLTANGGLTMGGSNNITLGNGTVAPTSGQLGNSYISTALSTVSTFTSGMTLFNLSIPSGGTYVVTIYCQIYSTTNCSAYISVPFFGTPPTLTSVSCGFSLVYGSANYYSCNATTIISARSSYSQSITFSYVTAPTSNLQYTYNYIRIG